MTVLQLVSIRHVLLPVPSIPADSMNDSAAVGEHPPRLVASSQHSR
ncbi:unnamed protein product [Callosobruchus maculatus]|uniref:Uncharacterized protein n=1 Tax=Callosobruchus maculatus TaxID=64391 RepID=A0A653C000_CALMS|nr:unnamed protein product [Callosobruchus maculatus]